MRLATLALATLVLADCSGDGSTLPPNPAPVTIPVIFTGGPVLTAEIASTAAERNQGLMGRTSLGAEAGMLFVYGLDRLPGGEYFWMKNTSIPLSIAFLDSTRRVIAIQQMTPFDTVTQHRPNAAWRYAIEVNRDWFLTHSVGIGSLATFTLPAGTIISP